MHTDNYNCCWLPCILSHESYMIVRIIKPTQYHDYTLDKLDMIRCLIHNCN